MPSWQQAFTWTVDAAAQRSNSIPVAEFERGSFQTPDGISAANWQIEVSNDDTTFDPVRNDSQVAIAAVALAADKVFVLPANVFKSNYARLFLSAVQDAERSFTVQLGGN